jgi:hypothetical protein
MLHHGCARPRGGGGLASGSVTLSTKLAKSKSAAALAGQQVTSRLPASGESQRGILTDSRCGIRTEVLGWPASKSGDLSTALRHPGLSWEAGCELKYQLRQLGSARHERRCRAAGGSVPVANCLSPSHPRHGRHQVTCEGWVSSAGAGREGSPLPGRSTTAQQLRWQVPYGARGATRAGGRVSGGA